MKIAFYVLSFISIASAVMAVTLKNIMRSALFLSLCLVSTAGLFILLSADFIATVQILVYAGGIMVLILFAILLTQKITGGLHPQANEQKTAAIITAATVLVVVGLTIKNTAFTVFTQETRAAGTTALIGRLLLTKYILAFEVASIVILAAIVATIAIARKED
ncbi:MAG: NADH-quinone oxidoreductase subunit J [Candidatus Omnitrophota bacterium]